MVGGALAAVLLVICTGGVVAVAANWDRLASPGEPTAPPGVPASSAGFADCPQRPDECNGGERQPGGTLVWALDGAPGAYFPWSPEGGTVQTLQAVHGILPHFGQFRPDGEYAFNRDLLAEEPRIVGEDPLQTQWRINPAAEWDDGTPITADDVIITWKMSTSEAEGHCLGCRSRSTALDAIASVEGSDSGRTVTVTYYDGQAEPEWFAFGSAHSVIGGFAPAHVAARHGWDVDDPADLGEYFAFLNENPPAFSGGPYLIESFDLETEVVKVPNPNWYGQVQPTLDRLVIRFLPDDASWAPAVRSGELHGGSPGSFAADAIAQLQDLPDVHVYVQSGPAWEHIDLNLANPWLGADTELRRAIFTAIDTATIAERNFGATFPDYTLRTNHLHRPDSEFYVDHLTGTGQGSGDLALARSILAAAGYEGYEDGAGALSKDGEQVGPLRLRSIPTPTRLLSMDLIQTQLAGIGIQVTIDPTNELGPTLREGDYDLIQFAWSGSPLFTGNGDQFWHSGSGDNFGGYANDEVDRLIEQAGQATTRAEAAALHDQMMEIVVNDAYVLPMYDNPIFVFVTDEFVNIRDNPYSSLRALHEHHTWGRAAEATGR